MHLLGLSYSGKYENEIIRCFKQGGMEIPLSLIRQNKEYVKPINRPQTPKAPYNYDTEEVVF
jgi:hypothetical protein